MTSSPAVTGFLGPNGVGKSTTIRMILDLDRPSAGSPEGVQWGRHLHFIPQRALTLDGPLLALGAVEGAWRPAAVLGIAGGRSMAPQMRQLAAAR